MARSDGVRSSTQPFRVQRSRFGSSSRNRSREVRTYENRSNETLHMGGKGFVDVPRKPLPSRALTAP